METKSSNYVCSINHEDPFEWIESGNGVFYINSDVYLYSLHYNMLQVTAHGYECLACMCEMASTKLSISHANSEEHKRALKLIRPIEEHGDDIVRPVGDCFHCGICNKVLSETDLKDHLTEDKVHRERKAFAKNCPSNVIREPICMCVRSGDETLVEKEHDKDPFETTNTSDGDVCYKNSGVYLNWYHHNTLQVNLKGWFRCAACACHVGDVEACPGHAESAQHMRLLGQMRPMEKYGDNIVKQVGDNFHCGICNKVFSETELQEHLEKNEAHASMKRFAKHCASAHVAKEKPVEPKTERDFVKLAIKDKYALVKKDNYENTVMFSSNFFCLLCEVGDSLDNYEAHLRTFGHVAMVNQHPYMEEHGFHMIRWISSDFMVCGACNTYVEAPFLRNHLMKKRHRCNIAAIKSDNLQFDNEVTFETVIELRPIKEYYNDPRRWLHPKDKRATNAIMRCGELGRWECLACDQDCLLEADLEDHMGQEAHIQNLEKAQLIEGYNKLHIRKFGKWIHCALCNEKVETMFRLFCHCLWDEHVDLLDTYIEENKRSYASTGRYDALKYYFTMKVNRKKVNEFYALNCMSSHGPKFDGTCNLCEVLLEGKKSNHVYGDEHTDKLERCVPLACFGDNFIRVINNKNKLQCYYCNVIFHHDQVYSHIDSASHLCRKINNVETSRTYFLTNAMKAEMAEEDDSDTINENDIVYEFVYGTAKHRGILICSGNTTKIRQAIKERSDALAAAKNRDALSQDAEDFCIVESSDAPHDDGLKEESIKHSVSSEYIYVSSSGGRVQEGASDTDFSAAVSGVALNLNDYDSEGCANANETLPLVDSSDDDLCDKRTNGDNSVPVDEIGMITDLHECDIKQQMRNDAVSSTDNGSNVKEQHKESHNENLTDSDSGVDSSIDLHMTPKAVAEFRDITHLKMFSTGEGHVTSSMNGNERRISKSNLQNINVDKECRNNITSFHDDSARSEHIVEPDSCVTDQESDSSFEKLDKECRSNIPSFHGVSARSGHIVEPDSCVTDQESDSSFENLDKESCKNIPCFNDDCAKSEHIVEPDSCVESDCSFEKLNKDYVSMGSENGSFLNESFGSALDDNKVVNEEDICENMSVFERVFMSNMKDNMVFVDSQGNVSTAYDTVHTEEKINIYENGTKEECKATECPEGSFKNTAISATQGSEIQKEKDDNSGSAVDNTNISDIQEIEPKEENEKAIVLGRHEDTTKDNEIYEDAVCHLQTENVCPDDNIIASRRLDNDTKVEDATPVENLNDSNTKHNRAEEVSVCPSENNNDEERTINMQGNETDIIVHSADDVMASETNDDKLQNAKIKVNEVKYKTCNICKIDINEKYYGLHGKSVKHKLLSNIVISVVNTLTSDLVDQLCIPLLGFGNCPQVNNGETEFYCDKCNVVMEVSEVPNHMWSERHRLSEMDETKCAELNDYIDMGTSLTKTCCYSAENLHSEDSEAAKNPVLRIVVDVEPRKALLDVEAFNCVKCVNGEYACFVCKHSVVDVQRHLASERHLELLKQYPLEGPTLMRKLDDSIDHCAVCNMVFLAVDRQDHIITIEHDRAFNKAMFVEQHTLDAACKFLNNQLQQKHKYAIKKMHECKVCDCLVVGSCRADHQKGRRHKAALKRQNKERYTRENNYTYNKRKNRPTFEMLRYINEYGENVDGKFTNQNEPC